MVSVSTTAYFSELSLFNEDKMNSSNLISLDWKHSVNDQMHSGRSEGPNVDAAWHFQTYQSGHCSSQSQNPLQQNTDGFYNPGNFKNLKRELTSKKNNSLKFLSSGLLSESGHNYEKDNSEQQEEKQSQITKTLSWLTENYEKTDGVCLPRCVLYSHYLDFCKKNHFVPAGAATFGKIIRQKFPKLTTRRLGTRGQSKYHYYGIGIKETSIYYQSVYSGKGLTRFSGIKIKTEGSSRKYSLSSKTGTLLPAFPNVDNLCLPHNVDKHKLTTFTMMYRTHCQRILDTVISGNFQEVQNFLLHFWQGMPSHLDEILRCDVTNDIIGLCDSILYKAIIDVLMPTTIQDLPETLSNEVKLFLKSLPVWLDTSLENMTQKLRDMKMKVVQGFIQSIRRQLSFVKLAQIARSVLQNSDNVQKMIQDALGIDFLEISCQTLYMSNLISSQQQTAINDYYDEFLSLLQHQSSVESFTEWIDNVLDRCVIQPSIKNKTSFDNYSADFLLHWAAIVSLITKDLTLQNSESFGSFHLLRMMLDEYIFLVIETQYDLIRDTYLQNNIKKLMKNTEEICLRPESRGSFCRQPMSAKHRRLKHDLFEKNTGVSSLVRGENQNQSNFPPVGSILPSGDITYSSLPNPGLKHTQPYRYHATNEDSKINDMRSIQVSPLRFHNHQHHHHHHYHHHHGYTPIDNSGYHLTQSFLPQAQKNRCSEYKIGDLQTAINPVNKLSDVHRKRLSGDFVGDFVKRYPCEYSRPASCKSKRCFNGKVGFAPYSASVSYLHNNNQGNFLEEGSLDNYNRCLDLQVASNSNKASAYSASFMEIVQPNSGWEPNIGQGIHQDDFSKTDTFYPSYTGW